MTAHESSFNRVAYGSLRDKARIATTNAPEDVRALVEHIFDRSMVIQCAPASVRERFTTAETSLRTGAYGGVRTVDIVSAVNDAVTRWKLPDYFRTTLSQWRSFMNDRRPVTRDLVHPGLAASDSDDVMSPGEALFIGSDMALQKLLVEENHIAPELWDARRRERERALAEAATESLTANMAPRLRAEVRRDDPLAWVREWRQYAPGELEIHRFLDELGLPR